MRPSEEGIWGWLMVDNESHGVEISIARGGEEIICAYPLGGFFSFFYIMYYLLGTRTRVQHYYSIKKNLISTTNNKVKYPYPDPEKQSKTPRLSGMGSTAHLLHQTKEKTWGESNEKTLSVNTARRAG